MDIAASPLDDWYIAAIDLVVLYQADTGADVSSLVSVLNTGYDLVHAMYTQRVRDAHVLDVWYNEAVCATVTAMDAPEVDGVLECIQHADWVMRELSSG